MLKFDDTLMTLVRKDIDSNNIPMLLGEPGIGKSSWLENLAKLMHTKCFTLACNQLADKADLTGARLVPVYEPVLDSDGNPTGEQNVIDYKQKFYPHAVIHDAIDYAEKNPRETPILFLDELNRTTPDVTSEALSIPTMRSIGSKKLPKNLKVVIAGNDKGNITSLDEASISRFVLYHVGPDTQTFLSLDANLNPFIANVLKAHPECIFGKHTAITAVTGNDDDNDGAEEFDFNEIIDDGDEMLQITTPRTISGLSRWLNGFTNQELMGLLSITFDRDGQQISLLQEAIEGHVGETVFTTYLMAEIAQNIMTTSNNQASLSVGKPACYDEMKKCQDITSLNEFINDLTDNDKSGIMVYALYEKADNKTYIEILAPQMNNLVGSDNKTLMKLATNDMLDTENVQALLSTNCNLAQALSIILEN